MSRVPKASHTRGLGERAIQEGCRQKAESSVSFLSMAVTAVSAVHQALSQPFMEESGRLCMTLWACKLRQGDSSKRLGPMTCGPEVIPVMSDEARELDVSKGHRMGSEPFQFTDAPFHLQGKLQNSVRAAGAQEGGFRTPACPLAFHTLTQLNTHTACRQDRHPGPW